MTVKIFVGDCRDVLRAMPADSVHCCVTSPPYWGLRDYKIAAGVWGGDPSCHHEWGDEVRKPYGAGLQGKTSQRAGRANIVEQETMRRAGNFCRCGAWRGVFGLEPTYQLYVDHAVEIFREVRRVLRPDGTLWLNLGDSYATGAGLVGERPGGGLQGDQWAGHESERKNGVGPMVQPNRMPQPGLKPKDLVGIPWRVAFALQDDGWWLRQDIVWQKPNPMPESVTDRCTKAHEYIFLLAKSERYFFDQDAILEPISEGTHLRVSQATLAEQYGSDRVPGKTNGPMKAVLRKTSVPGLGIKNNSSMDAALVAPGRMKRSGNKERKTSEERGCPDGTGKNQAGSVPWEGYRRNKRSVWTVTTQPFKEAHFATFPPALIEPCVLAGCPEGGIVLDPFGGSGTTGLVADRFKRDALLIELNPEYAAMAERRLMADGGMFCHVEVVAQQKEAAE